MHEFEPVASNENTGYDSNDPKQVSNRAAAAGQKQKRLLATLKLVMSQPNGRELLWDLLSMCGVHHTSFDINATVMAFKEGQRNVGLRLESQIIKADPIMYSKMREEFTNG